MILVSSVRFKCVCAVFIRCLFSPPSVCVCGERAHKQDDAGSYDPIRSVSKGQFFIR